MEAGLNVVRWTINFIVKWERELPGIAAVAGASSLIFEPVTTAAGAVLALQLAKIVKRNEKQLRRIASQAGATERNFERLLKILDKLPLNGD